MKINHVSQEPLVTPPKAKALAKPSVSSPAPEISQPEKSPKLMKAAHSEPEIRPEEVARGRALAVDPAYPSANVLKGTAERFLEETKLAK